MSSNPYTDKIAAASRARQVQIIKATPKRVEADDEAYHDRRFEIAMLKYYARRYPEQVLEIALELKSA